MGERACCWNADNGDRGEDDDGGGHCLAPGNLAESPERVQQCLSFGPADAAREPGQCRLAVTGLVERAQHELGHVRFPALRGPVMPGPAATLAPGEALLGEAVEHGHYRRMSQIPICWTAADLAYAQRVGGLPEHVHDGTF